MSKMSKQRETEPVLDNEVNDNDYSPQQDKSAMDIKTKECGAKYSDTSRRNLQRNSSSNNSVNNTPRGVNNQVSKPNSENKRDTRISPPSSSRALEKVLDLDWTEADDPTSRASTGQASMLSTEQTPREQDGQVTSSISTGRNFTQSRRRVVPKRQQSERESILDDQDAQELYDSARQIHRSESEPKLPASAL